MIFVGIDVAKDKHDCFIISSEGEVLADVFTISNSKEGFEHLLQTINTCTGIGGSKIKVGLEATGHYSYNLLGFLLDNGLPTFVINPLHTNLYRKSLSLRKTKTDTIASRANSETTYSPASFVSLPPSNASNLALISLIVILAHSSKLCTKKSLSKLLSQDKSIIVFNISDKVSVKSSGLILIKRTQAFFPEEITLDSIIFIVSPHEKISLKTTQLSLLISSE